MFRSTVEGYARFSPGTSKWTKHTIAEHVAIGGNGPIFVGTPSQVADGLETWVEEADIDGFNFVSRAHPLNESFYRSPNPANTPDLKTRRILSSPSLSKTSSSSCFRSFEREAFSGMTTRCPAEPIGRTSIRSLGRAALRLNT